MNLVKPKHVYIALCIIGVVLPYAQFIPWVLENGVNIRLTVGEIASSRPAAFGWLDVAVSAVALFAFIINDGRRNRVPGVWLPIVGTLTVGSLLVFRRTCFFGRSVLRRQLRRATSVDSG